MKKVFILLISAVLLFGICACSKTMPDNVDYTVLEARHIDYGEHSIEEDYWTSTVFTLNTNGKLTREDNFNISESEKIEVSISKNDVKKIIDILEKQKYSKNDNDATDGSIWKIKYFDKNGKIISDYDGYIYNKKGYKELSNLLNNFTNNNIDIKK